MNDQLLIEKIKTLPDGLFSRLDLNFASFICRSTGKPDNYPLFLAAALASNASVSKKFTCLDLSTLKGDLSCWFEDLTDLNFEAVQAKQTLTELPIPENWTTQLLEIPSAVSDAGSGQPEFKPLLLDGSLLYLYRDWKCEQKLAELFKSSAGRAEGFDAVTLENRITDISNMFNPMTDKIDWQQIAVMAALRNRLTIISGGPGTGKTTVAAAAAALMLELKNNLRIVLCAPTGKAQARLEEALISQLPELNCSQEVKDLTACLPVSTIHRLLGSRPDTPKFKYDENRQLMLDVIIVDEASMISQSMMKALLTAVPDNARIIMLGDMEQLASVESGMVLRDICRTIGSNNFSAEFIKDAHLAFPSGLPELPRQAESSPLNNCIVELKDNHRFAPDRGLGLSAAAIRELPDFPSVELLESVISRLKQDSTGEISISPLPAVYGGEFKNALHHTVRTMQVHKKPGENIPFLSYLEQDTIGEAFELFNRFRILCVHRRGIYGAIAVNQMIESFMAASGASGRFYKGKPIMITENNQEMKLFNGDVGLIWTDETGKLKAFFPDASGEQEGFRSFDVNTLPPFETVYAMTVHKAQGSGFQNILIICPPTVSPLMTREMIYTAITRAKKQAIIWSDESVLIEALRHRTSRHSNLAEKIQKSP